MKKIIILFLIFLVLAFTGILFKDNIYRVYLDFTGKLPQIQKGVEDALSQIQRTISTPPPLRSTKNVSGTLTQSEVIRLTNVERNKYGLASLKENSKLDLSAKAKAEDMILRQYFEHESPTGEKVSDLVERTGYEFIILGENLAMGNFEDDNDLVQAWMNSPGHRENILNPNYKEIGISVIKGMFESKEVWMAVQHFGSSLSSCPIISESLKIRIESKQDRISDLETSLNNLKNHLNNRKTVEEYNSLVDEYNALVSETKILISEYNNQVKVFNECLSTLTK